MRNSQNGFTLIPLIIGVVLISTAIVGSFYIKQVKQDPTKVVIVATITPTPTISKKTLITPKVLGKYTSEEYGYSVEFPKDWELYSGYSRGSEIFTLYHPKCKGQDLVLPEKTTSCTTLSLPFFVGDTGWGYRNNRQVEEKVVLKGNVKADKTTFYYDTGILISWQFDKVVPSENFEEGVTLVAFADVNENYTPGSLETVDKIIKSINFE